MNTKVETQGSALDLVKISAAVLIVVAAIGAFYYFDQVDQLIRVPGLIAAVVVAVIVGLQSEQGRSLTGFLKNAQIEVRKVVWPTVQETRTTTLMVVVVVIVASVVLWLFDMALGYLARLITG